MRKWTSLLSIFIILFVFSGIGYGDSNKSINVIMNGENELVTQVKVIKDGQVIDMEIPSFVYIDRTLVPVRMAENLGAKVDWDAKTKTAIVTHNGKTINLTIDSDVATINGEKDQLDNNSIPRLVRFENDNGSRTMIPLAYLTEMLGYEIGWDSEAKAASINTKKKEPEKKPDIKPEKEPEENIKYEASNKVKTVKRETVDGKEAIVIYGTNKVKTKTMRLTNPERIVVDLIDSNLEGSTFYNFDYELGFIKGIRVSQFLPDNNYKPDDKIVRFVLDIKDGMVDPNIEIETYDDRIVMFPEVNSWDNLNYTVDGKKRNLVINNLMETNYSIRYDDLTKSMEISIPKHAVDIVGGILPISDNLVEELKIVENSSETKLFIKFRRNIEYTQLSRDIDDKIVLQIKADSNIKPSDRIIVIDAGHGGKDPGASKNGIIEKNLALEITLKLEQALKGEGYNIIMTRDNDVFVDLYERSNIANKNYADIFISIHGNSFTNPDVNGIEILYTPVDGDPIKDKAEKALAQSVLNEVIKETGANSRGLVKSKVVVTRTTKMPAILVEVGFISNPKEATLITSDVYQNKIIAGMLKGIENFFEEY